MSGYPPASGIAANNQEHPRQLSDGTYTTEGKFRIMEEICKRVCGKETLAAICSEANMPRIMTIYSWMSKDLQIAKMYNEARATRAFSRGDKIDAITELVLRGVLDANSARVVIDAEKWQMTKERPRDFGERVAVEHDVSDALADAVQAARIRASNIECLPITVTATEIECQDEDGDEH